MVRGMSEAELELALRTRAGPLLRCQRHAKHRALGASTGQRTPPERRDVAMAKSAIDEGALVRGSRAMAGGPERHV